MWDALRLMGKAMKMKFRRQHPFHPYIVDFVCLEARLVVEIDGLSHDSRQQYDKRREAYLRGLGYEVLRFSDSDVLKNLEAVAETVAQTIRKRPGKFFSPLAGEKAKS